MIYYDTHRIVADTMEELLEFVERYEVPSNYFTPHPRYAHYIYTAHPKDTEILKVLKSLKTAIGVSPDELIFRAYIMNKNYKKNYD